MNQYIHIGRKIGQKQFYIQSIITTLQKNEKAHVMGVDSSLDDTLRAVRQKVPTVKMEDWIDNRKKIGYIFYKKPVNSNKK